jgi:hypothetical protein
MAAGTLASCTTAEPRTLVVGRLLPRAVDSRGEAAQLALLEMLRSGLLTSWCQQRSVPGLPPNRHAGDTTTLILTYEDPTPFTEANPSVEWDDQTLVLSRQKW